MDKNEIIRKIIRPVVNIFVRLGCNYNEVKSILMTEFVNESLNQGLSSHCAIAAKTGIDRRNISSIINNQQSKVPPTGIDLIVNEIYNYGVKGVDIGLKGNNSIESIMKTVSNGKYTYDSVLNELIQSDRIKIINNKVVYNNIDLQGYITQENHSEILGSTISRCSSTLRHLENNNDLIYKSCFSQQIQPSESSLVNSIIFKMAKDHKENVIEVLKKYESTDERIYPKIGILQIQFDGNL